jgi:pyruvate formate lyase activating enzyme
MRELKGNIHSTESFGSADGPGVRFLIFLQGCSMRCKFCHNPDTWQIGPCGTSYTATTDELLRQAMCYRSYWGQNGGITVSGGEPLLQIDFLLDLFKKAKQAGIHTTLDTSGQPFTRTAPFFNKFQALMADTNLVLLDIKHTDDGKHRELTGHSNQNILDLARYLDEIQKPVWIRHVLIPGITDSEEDLTHLDAFIQSLGNVQRVEVLPYHTMGVFKWAVLNLDYPLEGVHPPTEAQIKRANELLHTNRYLSACSYVHIFDNRNALDSAGSANRQRLIIN